MYMSPIHTHIVRLLCIKVGKILHTTNTFECCTGCKDCKWIKQVQNEAKW